MRAKGEHAAAPLAYLGLGSNVGNRRAHLLGALREIGTFARVKRVSSFYRTEPVGFRDQPHFWNAAVEIAWPGTPGALLLVVREVERRVGRTPTFANGPREIDVDILDLGGGSAPDATRSCRTRGSPSAASRSFLSPRSVRTGSIRARGPESLNCSGGCRARPECGKSENGVRSSPDTCEQSARNNAATSSARLSVKT